MLSPLFYNRDFTINLFQPGSWLKVAAARWSFEGGPDTAVLSGAATSRVSDLNFAEALTLLRCPVDLVDDSGQPAWWGYVSAIEFFNGKIRVKADLEQLTNRVKVRYITQPIQTNQWTSTITETSWSDDLPSQAIYGIKEQIITLPDSTADQAHAAAILALNDLGWPQALPLPVLKSDFRMTFTLRGWWHTLGWQHYSQSNGIIENLYEGPGTQFVGSSTADQTVYQSFTVDTGDWSAYQVWLKAGLKGAPTDSMQVDICSDSSGSPGTVLASSIALSHTAFSATFAWLCFQFSSPLPLSAGLYWLKIHRTGANHGSNNYRLKVDEFESYAGGTCWVTGSPRTTPADLLFRVVGGAETTEQICAVVTDSAQFLAGARIETTSGVYTNPFRIGNQTALQEITNHLHAGNADSLKLQAEITQDRYLRVYLRPGPSSAEGTGFGGMGLRINQDGIIVDRAGIVLPAWTPAAGRWAVVSGAWGEGGSEYQQVKDRVLLEMVEYDPVSEGLRAG